jgi:nucleoside 2-deoxyribosyltransferase
MRQGAQLTSDFVLANITQYSAGTCSEIFYGHQLGKTVVCVVQPDMVNDIFIKFSANCLTTSLDKAMEWIRQEVCHQERTRRRQADQIFFGVKE